MTKGVCGGGGGDGYQVAAVGICGNGTTSSSSSL